jgi:signal transduction histidine kinase/CheY-like chemotaxis protein
MGSTGKHDDDDPTDDAQLRSALANAQAILHAQQRAERELHSTIAALEEETRVLELLHRTGQTLASELELRAVLQAVTDAGTRLAGAEFGAFFYTARDPSGDVFQLYTLSGAPREAFEKFDHPRATPLFGPTFEGRAVIRCDDVHEDPRYGHWAPHHGMPPGHLPVCSYLAVPVHSRSGEVLGGLFFGHHERGVFTERSERLLVGMAAQAAIAIDNARLYEDVRRALEAEREARAEIERISIMKDEFLATLSHELRTPLNAVLGWAEILLARTPADSPLRRGVETISRNARAQTQLIEDLLDMNRIVSGKLRLDVQQLELATVARAAIDTVRPSAEAKEIRLRATLDPDAGPVFGDPHRVQQIVWNLLSNAIKFTPKHGRVDVVLRRINSHVELTISDSGIGIPAEVLPHVFERFRQADSSTTRKHGGLGLGLAIVKQLVELHGGSVRVESAGRDAGATFTVTLPVRALSPAPEPVPRDEAASQVDVVLSGLTILVVDDDLDARELIALVLEAAHAEVITAASADEAFALLQTRRPHLVISDIGMPGRDGYQLMKEIRALPADAGGRTPGIALTAFARSEDRTRALLAGYQVHVAKPIDPHELVVTVGSLTGRTPVP